MSWRERREGERERWSQRERERERGVHLDEGPGGRTVEHEAGEEIGLAKSHSRL